MSIAASALAACGAPPIAQVPSGTERVAVNSGPALQKYEMDAAESNRAALERAVLVNRIRELQGQVSGLRSYLVVKTVADEINKPKGVPQGGIKRNDEGKLAVTHPPEAAARDSDRGPSRAGAAGKASNKAAVGRHEAKRETKVLRKAVIAPGEKVAPKVQRTSDTQRPRPIERDGGSQEEAAQASAPRKTDLRVVPRAVSKTSLILTPGAPLRQEFDAWALSEGWTPVWMQGTPHDVVTTRATYAGDVMGATTQFIKDFNASQRATVSQHPQQLGVSFWRANSTVVIYAIKGAQR